MASASACVLLFAPLAVANAQQWIGVNPSWSTASNWDTNTVPDGRDVTVVFADNTVAAPIQNIGQSFTHLQVGNNAAVHIVGTPDVLAPDDPSNPGFPSPFDPATITVGGGSSVLLEFATTPPPGPFGPDPALLSVSVGANSSFELISRGKFEQSQITKTGSGDFAFSIGGAASIAVEEGTLYTSGGGSATVGVITVSAGASLQGSGVRDAFFIGTSIQIAEDGNLLSQGSVNDFVAESAGVSLEGKFNFRLGTLKDDSDGNAGIDWSRLNVTDGFVSFGANSLLTLNFSLANDPDGGNSFWDSSHTWQVINADAYGGTLAVETPAYSSGTFSFDSGIGQLSYTVPEPGSLALLGLGSLLFLRRRRVTQA